VLERQTLSHLTNLRTLVVEDDNTSAEVLQIMLSTFRYVELVGTAQSGPQATRMIVALKPDLVMLSVSLPEINGLEVAVSARNSRAPPSIIFLSHSRQFAYAAFELAAVDYLLKPVSYERLESALSRVPESRSAGQSDTACKREFWVHRRDGHVRVDIDHVELIEAQGDYVLLHTSDARHMIHMTIEHIMEQLDSERFIRIHRSTIVRRSQIKAIAHRGKGRWSAELRTGVAMHIGQKYLPGVKLFAAGE
jgi:DNA-binding LytR/AlgR family response regulator